MNSAVFGIKKTEKKNYILPNNKYQYSFMVHASGIELSDKI